MINNPITVYCVLGTPYNRTVFSVQLYCVLSTLYNYDVFSVLCTAVLLASFSNKSSNRSSTDRIILKPIPCVARSNVWVCPSRVWPTPFKTSLQK